MEGTALIAQERLRQVADEGFTAAIDDEWDEDLAAAAACYAMPMYRREVVHDTGGPTGLPVDWPWSDEWWKPTPDDRIRELVKAGALIAAEIDRLQRLQAAKQ